MTRKHRAFTLLELLLAIAITSVLAATVYASLMVATRTREKAADTVGKNRELRLALDLVRRDLQAAPPPTGTLAGGFVGEDDNQNDVISFTTTNAFLPTDDRLSDLINVSISLAEDPDDDQTLMLVRGITTNLLSPATTEPTTQVLARGIIGWDAAYSDGSDWLDDWDSTQHDNALPLSARITLYHQDPNSSDDDQITLLIWLPAGQRGDSIFSGSAGR
jgi:general secretion pathway protein J